MVALTQIGKRIVLVVKRTDGREIDQVRRIKGPGDFWHGDWLGQAALAGQANQPAGGEADMLIAKQAAALGASRYANVGTAMRRQESNDHFTLLVQSCLL
jgi:hypothetical protein